MNADYPRMFTDGIASTMLRMAPGMGGYIFVTHYNTNTDSYLMPENVGGYRSILPTTTICTSSTNSTTWDGLPPTATSRKARCASMYSFPTHPKQVYNYEGMDPDKMISLAQLHFYQGHMDGHRCGKGRLKKDFGPLPTQSRGPPRSMISNSSLTTTPPTTSWTISLPAGQSLVWQIQSAGAELQTTAGETGRYAFGILPSQQAGKGQDVRRHPRPGATCTAIVH